jgi:Thioredoxin like C-terminal domain/AhpC/TSA family
MRPALEPPLPELPAELEWLNASWVRLSTLLGRGVVLVWFWDCASLNSIRALPYVREWHARYADAGLHIVGVHAPQFDFGRDRRVVEDAVARLSIDFPVALDSDFTVWRLYANEVWPAVYLGDRRGLLRWYHPGEGEYLDGELAIQDLLREIDEDIDLPDPLPALRATDGPDALVRAPTPHRYLERDRSGRAIAAGDELAIRYEAAGAAAVLDGSGEIDVLLDGRPIRTLALDGPRLYELVEGDRHEEHELRLRFSAPALAYAFSFSPGPA